MKENSRNTPRRVSRTISLAILGALPFAAGIANAAPLALPAPLTFGAGPLGKLDVQGIASGMAFYQDSPQGVAGTLGAKNVGADITNGMVIFQKETGPLQFYAQAGAYSFPTLAAGFNSSTAAINEFGALPVAYLKYAPNSAFSVEIGKLPTLIGAEDGFTYQNINIERGLLWDVEPIISRGIQLNYSAGPISASVSWNDGYYSNRYNWVDGNLTYTINGENSLEFYGGGNLAGGGGSTSNTAVSGNITDGADDSDIYGLIYTYSSGPWMVEPYFQYMHTPAQPLIGPNHGFDNYGGALLADYSITKDVSLAGRVEYLRVGGTPGLGENKFAQGITDLPVDSHAWSITVTPTYQSGGFFARAELSYVAASCPAGDGGFAGNNSTNTTQLRGLLETGLMF